MGDLLARLIASGTPADIVGEVAMLIARAEVDRQAIESRRSADRERQSARRHVTSRDITGDNVMSQDVTDTPPALDKEIPPRPPKEINLTPRVGIALARKAAGFGPPDGVELPLWNEFCSQRKKPLSSTSYAAIVNKLVEAAQVGWPPGDLVSRAIESTWETVFIPKDRPNGNHLPAKGNHSGLGRTALAALSVFGEPEHETGGPEAAPLRRIGPGASEPRAITGNA